MSEHDDTLLDEDLGDEEYDLGNDEEEALLADDYELERQNSYKGEEETDDVLDLGVTDALDDLDGEDENIEFSRSKTDKNNENDFYEDGENPDNRYDQDENNEYNKDEQAHSRQYEERSTGDSVNISSNIGKGDLREKLQKNVQKICVGNGQGLEDDDCEEAKERRNRFQNERTIVSPKMNTNIPDNLENVVTAEPSSRLSFRERGRGRIIRGSRGGGCGIVIGAGGGGRFNTQDSGNFNPRFGGIRNPNFENHQLSCRPPLLDTRPPFLLGVPNNVQNQQIIYQQPNPQLQPFQHYSPNGPIQGPPHFVDNRTQFNPQNQFQGPRPIGPRLDYGPRGGVAVAAAAVVAAAAGLSGSLQGPSYNCSSNQSPYVQIQSAAGFQNPLQDNQPRHVQSNQAPLLQGNPGGSLLGSPSPLVPGTPAPLLQGNQSLPMQGFPRPQPFPQGPPGTHHNVKIPSQTPFESRPAPPFQESQFEARPVYHSRPSYSSHVPISNQFNNNPLSVPPEPTPNVPLPSGHKILINPHFRGAVQPTGDARHVWDSAQQQAPAQSQVSGGLFAQPSASYQNQTSYSQSQQGSTHYQQSYQQNKSDDPYAYFSDVWQENKPQKMSTVSPTKQYSSESNYSRDGNYSDNYKSDSQWREKVYQEDHRSAHPSYQDREVSSKTRNEHVPKSRPLSSNSYRDDGYEQSHTQKSLSCSARSSIMPGRGTQRLPQKRLSDSLDRPLRDLSPKRIKPANRNLQEVRTVDTLTDSTAIEKKDEENDPEMQEYRKKMEEQKRLREKILREKENRRKLAAMEKQNEEAKMNEASGEGTQQQEAKPVSTLLGVVKESFAMNRSQPTIGRGRARPVNVQTTEGTERPGGIRTVRTVQTVSTNDSIDLVTGKEGNGSQSNESSGRVLTGVQSGLRRVVIQKPLSSQKIATTIQKTVSNLQKGQGYSQTKVVTLQNATQAQAVTMKKLTCPVQKTLGSSQRIVTQKQVGTLQKTVINTQELANANTQKVVVNTQHNQRVVIQKTLAQQKKLSEIKTNTVKLENLAASTCEAQIRRMCQGIGTIESVQMGERSATIVFKTQSAAMVFHKKYQRKMLDLSLITVRLIPQPSGTKNAATVLKVS